MPETSISWSSSNAAVASVSSNGLITALGVGSADVIATAGAASATAQVAVLQVPTQLVKVSGDNQAGTAGQALAAPLVVQVNDALGNPISGVTVSFALLQGAGSPTTPTVTTGADGRASTAFTTGTVAGSSQVSATITTTTISVSFAETTTAGAPTSMASATGNDQHAAPGTVVSVPPAVLIKDAEGNPVSGVPVVFTVAAGGGSVTGGSTVTNAGGIAQVGSWTLGRSGSNRLLATAAPAGLSGNPVTFTATADAIVGHPATMVRAAGNGQHAAPGTAVPVNPAVLITDENSKPVAGVSVVFEVVSGGGSVSGGATATGTNGIAEVGSWTLGTGTNVLRATAAGTGISGNPIRFTATLSAGLFDIKIQYLTPATTAQKNAFTHARLRWESVITGDLEDTPLQAAAGDCGPGTPAVNETVDDVLILVSLETIDGPGGILARAGPCDRRGSAGLTILGVMQFDTEDLDGLQTDGLLSEVVEHEMGHVLGFGTLWEIQGLLADAAVSGGTDPHFTGGHAVDAFNAIGGTTYTSGAKVPVEAFGGAGTADSHWRESVFDNELMTGYINQGPNPLSKVTVASLEDLGYTVNLSAADSYTFTSALRAFSRGPSVRLQNDVLSIPIKVVDRTGRVTRELRR